MKKKINHDNLLPSDFCSKTELLEYANHFNMDFDIYHNLLSQIALKNEEVSQKAITPITAQVAPVQ